MRLTRNNASRLAGVELSCDVCAEPPSLMMKSVALRILQIAFFGVLASASAHAQSELTGERFPYAAFDRMPTTPITIGGGTLDIAFAPGEFALPRSAIMAWLERSAKAVSIYFGKFPVASARILIVPIAGRGARGSQDFGFRGAATSEARRRHERSRSPQRLGRRA